MPQVVQTVASAATFGCGYSTSMALGSGFEVLARPWQRARRQHYLDSSEMSCRWSYAAGSTPPPLVSRWRRRDRFACGRRREHGPIRAGRAISGPLAEAAFEARSHPGCRAFRAFYQMRSFRPGAALALPAFDVLSISEISTPRAAQIPSWSSYLPASPSSGFSGSPSNASCSTASTFTCPSMPSTACGRRSGPWSLARRARQGGPRGRAGFAGRSPHARRSRHRPLGPYG